MNLEKADMELLLQESKEFEQNINIDKAVDVIMESTEDKGKDCTAMHMAT